MARKRSKTAIIYVRQSTAREESISPEVQIEHCLSACGRQGYDVARDPATGEIATVDLNLSGRSFKHRSIVPIIQRVANGEAQVVMTWKWSRWGRNLIESLLCLAELKQAGGALESATEPMDASTPAGRFSVTQMLAIAEFQSDQIGESWRDAKRSMILKKGLPPTGGHRLGYQYDKTKKLYIPDPTAGPALARAYAMFNSGASFHALTGEMRRHGVRSTRGNPIAEPGLRYAMDSGFAAGFIRLGKPGALLEEDMLDELDVERDQVLYLPGLNREGQPGWEPLISDETWTEYQVRRRTRRALPARARNATQPLTGLLRCAGCRKRMLYRPDRKRWNCCTTRLKRAGEDCPIHVTIAQGEVTEAVFDWLRARRDGRDTDSVRALLSRQQAARRAHDGIAALEAALRREERRRQNLLDMIADGTLDRTEVRSKLDEIRKEIDRITDEIVDARRDQAVDRMPPASSFGAVLDGWDHIQPSILNTAVHTLIDVIYIYPFRQFPRVVIIGRGEPKPPLPEVAVSADDSTGRTCLGCREFLPRDEFYVRVRNGKEQLFSRCKRCKAAAAAEWRQAQKVLKQEGTDPR